MILWESADLFFGELLYVAVAIFLVRKSGPGWQISVVMASVYLSVPLAVMRLGVASAIYASDVIVPLVLAGLAIRRPPWFVSWVSEPETRSIALASILIPICMGLVLSMAGVYTFGIADAQYFFRQVCYVGVFVLCAGMSSEHFAVDGFARLTVLLTLGLVVAGLLQYGGVVDWDVFTPLTGRESAGLGTLGVGFLGLFRGSVGHFCAFGGLFFLYLTVSRGAMVLTGSFGWALCLIVLVLSTSRAGILAHAVGVALAVLLAFRGDALRIVVVTGSVSLLAFLVYSSAPSLMGDPTLDRLRPSSGVLMGSEDVSTTGRVEMWRLSLTYFVDQPSRLLTGVGPAADVQMADFLGGFGAHNEFIDIVFKGGLLALYALLQFYWRVARRIAAALPASRPSSAFGLAFVAATFVIALPQNALIGKHASHGAILLTYATLGVFCGGAGRLVADRNAPSGRS
ncbi:MAG: O-antigen ligase family protein [Candidatus Coatesbacteria bacterium]